MSGCIGFEVKIQSVLVEYRQGIFRVAAKLKFNARQEQYLRGTSQGVLH